MSLTLKPIKKKPYKKKFKPKKASMSWFDEIEKTEAKPSLFFYDTSIDQPVDNLDHIVSTSQLLDNIKGDLIRAHIGCFRYLEDGVVQHSLNAYQWAIRHGSQNIPFEFFNLQTPNSSELFFSNFESLKHYWNKWIELNFSYIGESNYIIQLAQLTSKEAATKGPCPLCGLPVKEKEGKFGRFWGCSGWPKCTATWNEKFIPNREVRDYLKNKKKNGDFSIEKGKEKVLQAEEKKISKQMANLEL